jgi:ketosteroid isomerase-like protein
MADNRDFEDIVERHHAALGGIINGDPSGYKALYADTEDVTLSNPFGPPARGREAVFRTLDGAASHYEGGELREFETVAKHVGADMAYTHVLERCVAKVVGVDDARPVTLRVTEVFRRESGGWRLVHRHADPIAAPRPPETVVKG